MMSDLLATAFLQDAGARERACEAALQSGHLGVLAVCEPSTGAWTYVASPDVPYGVIHEFPHGRRTS